MQMRPLGNTDVRVSPIVYGAMDFERRARAERVRTIHAAIDAGMTSLDTAPLYGLGESERAIGEAIADRRARVQILGKVGLRWDGEHGEVMFTVADAHGVRRAVRRDSRPASVRRDVEESLRRLGVEQLDLCQVHHPDPRVPIEDTMGALLQLRQEGKLRAIGVSNFDAAQVEAAQRALGEVPLASVQSEYNLLRREAERRLVPTVAELGASFVAYSPLLHGLLAGRMQGRRRLSVEDHRRWNVLFHPVNVERIERGRQRGLEPLARRHGVGSAQIALAWVLDQPGVTAAIAGGSTPAQVQANVRAAEIRLLAGERAGLMAELERVSIDPDLQPRRRDALRERGERIAGKLLDRVARRVPWAWPRD